MESSFDLHDNEQVLIRLKEQKPINQDMLYPPPEEEDFHKIVYEDMIVSLYY